MQGTKREMFRRQRGLRSDLCLLVLLALPHKIRAFPRPLPPISPTGNDTAVSKNGLVIPEKFD